MLEKYYKILCIIGKYKTLKEVESQSKEMYALYKVCGLPIFCELISWKLYELNNEEIKSSDLITHVNRLFKVLNKQQFMLAENLISNRESMYSCCSIVLDSSFDSDFVEAFNIIKDNKDFLDLLELVSVQKNKLNKYEIMKFFDD